MKRMIFASIALLLTSSFVQAGWFNRCGSCCPRTRVSCEPRVMCEPACEPTPPVCFKKIMVPQTIQVEKEIEVSAIKIVEPRPDIIERIPVAPTEVRTPQPPLVIQQPDMISYRCNPDRIVHHKQAPSIRYECPVDSCAR